MSAPAQRADPWDTLAVQPSSPEQEVVRLTKALERERGLRDQTERLLEDKTRDLYLAREQLQAQHERLLQAEQQERARLARELDIAKRIQASILPQRLEIAGLEIAAAMVPCAEMGGDYYDVRPAPDGAWIGIGDVAGHGVPAGLVMLMMQTVTAALTALAPDDAQASPAEVLARVNDVLYENIRLRMRSDEHITASLLRYHTDGRVRYAGAHEDIVVCRAATGESECLETVGPWLGVMADIRRVTRERVFQLEPGDVMVLYSDGITEAMDAQGIQFGLSRLCETVERLRERPVDEIRDALMAAVQAWGGQPADDVTCLVLRYSAASR